MEPIHNLHWIDDTAFPKIGGKKKKPRSVRGGRGRVAWSYHNPVRVLFGSGRFDETAGLLAGRRYGLVTYGEPLFAELAAQVAATAGPPASVVDDVQPNPDYEQLAGSCRRIAADLEDRGLLEPNGVGLAGWIAKRVAQGAPELDDLVETAESERQASAFEQTLERIKKVLDERVQEVRLSRRLTESPACLVAPDFGMSRRLEKMLSMAGENLPASKPILELNGEHPLVTRLRECNDEALFEDLCELLLGQAQLAEGGQLDDPAAFVKRLNRLVLGQAPSGRIIV